MSGWNVYRTLYDINQEVKRMNLEEMKVDPKLFARVQLMDDMLNFRKTDHVPTAPMVQYLPILMYGDTTIQDVMMDYSKAEDCFVRYHTEFNPDLASGPQPIFPGKPLDILDCQYIRWPGRHLSNPNAPFQVLDREDGYMSPDEYLEYAEDPSGFIMRKILPRHYNALKGFEMLDFSNAVWQGGLYGMIPCALPEVKKAFEALSLAGCEMLKYAQAGGKIMGRLASMGWPSLCDYASSAPFDVFNDTLRGFLNTTMDMIEYPDELLAAIRTCTKIQVRGIKNAFATQPFVKNVVFFIHNGFDMFMSNEQFETFYWPGLKACVDAVIECGGTPHLLIEDCFDNKIDILVRDLPANKCILTLINCNPEKWKAACQGKIAISGGINATILEYGTTDEVKQHVKNVMDIWSPGGGYLVNCDAILDNAKPDNVRALFDTAMNYQQKF